MDYIFINFIEKKRRNESIMVRGFCIFLKKAFTTPWFRGVSIGVVGFVMELYLLI